jgi:hypothetical protein
MCIPLSLLGNGSVKTLLRQRKHTKQWKNFGGHRFLCGLCLIKESRGLLLPRTYCFSSVHFRGVRKAIPSLYTVCARSFFVLLSLKPQELRKNWIGHASVLNIFRCCACLSNFARETCRNTRRSRYRVSFGPIVISLKLNYKFVNKCIVEIFTKIARFQVFVSVSVNCRLSFGTWRRVV